MIADLLLFLAPVGLALLVLRLAFRPDKQEWRRTSRTTSTRNGRPWWKDNEPY